ncbi:MAG: LCP family protein [bacterium]|nr:LCP family protein [bacterium]
MRPGYQEIRRRRGKFKSPFGFSGLIPYRKIIKILILFLLITFPIYCLLDKSNLDIKRLKNINVLLVGVNNEQLSILAVASVNFKQQKYSILSIPVDTKVSTKLGNRTFSNIYQGGGIKLTITRLESLLNDRIPYYIIANRKNAQKIVDLLDGVEILITKEISFKDKLNEIAVNIPSGWQKLDGRKASQYAYLSCKEEGKNEIIERQQKYIESLTRKLFSQKSPVFVSESIVQRLKENVFTNLTSKDISYFISKLSKFNYKELKLATLTLIGKIDSSGEYYIPDAEKNKNLLSKLLNVKEVGNQKVKEAQKELEKEELEKRELEKKIKDLAKDKEAKNNLKSIKIRILNGCGRKEIARNLQKKLKANKDLTVIEVGNADNFNYENTIIYDHVGKSSNADYVKNRFLNKGVIKQSVSKTVLADITIIIGKDFKD